MVIGARRRGASSRRIASCLCAYHLETIWRADARQDNFPPGPRLAADAMPAVV